MPNKVALEIDYPPTFEPRWGYGKPPNAAMQKLLSSAENNMVGLLEEAKQYGEFFQTIPMNKVDDRGPFWVNGWFPLLDSISLYSMLVRLKPARFIEIGSGNSTKFARAAITNHSLPTHLLSIDPQPRAEVDDLSDGVIRTGLETVDLSTFEHLESTDLIFFDGSHRCLQNSDVTAFFMDVLPRLPRGITIGIHDILWPNDYYPDWRERYYNEQYVLGAYLVGGGGRTRIEFSSYYAGMALAERVKAAIPPDIYVQWMEKRGFVSGGCLFFRNPHQLLGEGASTDVGDPEETRSFSPLQTLRRIFR